MSSKHEELCGVFLAESSHVDGPQGGVQAARRRFGQRLREGAVLLGGEPRRDHPARRAAERYAGQYRLRADPDPDPEIEAAARG